MKKFFALTTLSVCLLCNVTANARSLYGGNVSDIINAFKVTGNLFEFSVWGTEYYTYNGIKRCELHFGNSQDNLVRFRLNNDNSVARMLISFPSSSGMDTSIQAGALAGVACAAYDIDDNDYKQMWMTFLQDMVDSVHSNYFHKKYPLWSYRTHQYIVMDVEMNLSKVDLYFYAE